MTDFASYHIVDNQNLWFLWKLFHVASTSLKITLASSFLKCFLEKEKEHSNAENTEDFTKVQWQNHSKIDKISMKLCRVCLIGANSENGKLGRPGFRVDYQILTTAGLADFEGLPSPLLQKAECLADIGEIFAFI